MKKLILLIGILTLTSCVNYQPGQKNVDTFSDAHIPTTTKNVNIEKLSEQVDQGLYKITIDDTTQILLYRGVESCTMVKLK
jgi:hypothetical protein